MRVAWGWAAAWLLCAGGALAGAGGEAREDGPREGRDGRDLPGLPPERRAQEDWRSVLEAVRASRLPVAQRRPIATLIVREADRHGLDPRLVVAVIQAESTFNPRAVSPAGARGLMQMMPATGRWLLERQGERLTSSKRLFDPELNIRLGTAYLAELIRRFGSVEHALVAYNAGPTAARRILARPARRASFTAGYPRRVLREFERLKQQEVSVRLDPPPADVSTSI